VLLVVLLVVSPMFIWVKVSLVGADPITGNVTERNTFTVSEGPKGVLSATLDPGTYYLNPYLYNVAEIKLQSQRFELSGEDAIEFLTVDGFAIKVEGTLEYAITRDKAALLTHEVGELDEILQKLIGNITPPDAIASSVRDRELAVQTRGMYGQQIEQAKSKAKLVRQRPTRRGQEG
jgi:regulator of protease activity HflC (stomatin/prohibitin superfamily)